MRRVRQTAIRTATLLSTLSTLAVAPAAAQQFVSTRTAPQTVTPRQIAANAHAALLVVRALGEDGDTLGLGTGFLVGDDGLFITNYHVIQEAAKLKVKPLDAPEVTDVSLIAVDPASDLALMRIAPPQGMKPLKLGSDLQMEVGDRVFVMGNPLGMSGTFTDGMVSGLRPLEGVGMLQISAPISPGSSGGPVMNERGEVIGVATMMVMGGQNLNMAVPVRYLRPMMTARPEPRPFSAALLEPAANVRAGLALVGDGEDPRMHERRGGRAERSPAREVSDQLTLIAPMLLIRGYTAAGDVKSGQAAQAQSGTQEFTLEQGVTYLVTARCDAACSNVDLQLTDDAGQVLQSDMDDDDYPTVSFTAPKSGTYRVNVRMARCVAQSCAYGVALFRRDPSAAIPSAKSTRRD